MYNNDFQLSKSRLLPTKVILMMLSCYFEFEKAPSVSVMILLIFHEVTLISLSGIFYQFTEDYEGRTAIFLMSDMFMVKKNKMKSLVKTIRKLCR